MQVSINLIQQVTVAMATLRVLCSFTEREKCLLTVQGLSPLLEAALGVFYLNLLSVCDSNFCDTELILDSADDIFTLHVASCTDCTNT